ncbi:hypothetical protein TrLO_g14772 [Triparma laevis f. longispina]|uniref:Uncharacterized protein n=1 Tax=Triparma laevis f. longispina TaxID=1714387 RepID=A0A9W7DTP2_9STRA|nr:hypothetical protein TrLO_g14772 [Triparma laevis f. longispina]
MPSPSNMMYSWHIETPQEQIIPPPSSSTGPSPSQILAEARQQISRNLGLQFRLVLRAMAQISFFLARASESESESAGFCSVSFSF